MDAMQTIRASRGLIARITRELGLSRGAVSQWGRIPAERVLDVERVTGIPRYQLRADIYPPPVAGQSQLTDNTSADATAVSNYPGAAA